MDFQFNLVDYTNLPVFDFSTEETTTTAVITSNLEMEPVISEELRNTINAIKTLFKRNIRPLKQRNKRFVSFTLPMSRKAWDKLFPDAVTLAGRKSNLLKELTISKIARKSAAEPEALDYLFGNLWDFTKVADTVGWVQDIQFF